MSFLLAHHGIEPMEYPVLVAMFVVGIWLGWDMIGRMTAPRPDPVHPTDPTVVSAFDNSSK
jgi:hypothetical protein